jgi:hypothetical protein
LPSTFGYVLSPSGDRTLRFLLEVDSQLDQAERELKSFAAEVERVNAMRASVPIDEDGAAQAVAQTEAVKRSVNDLDGEKLKPCQAAFPPRSATISRSLLSMC